jgi:CRP-like cAMP-binding protein
MIAASKTVTLAPGETLLSEGEYGRDLYLILEGRLELSATAADNAELIMAILWRGEYTGDDGLLAGMPYKSSARAQLPTQVLQVPEQVTQRLMEIVPSEGRWQNARAEILACGERVMAG